MGKRKKEKRWLGLDLHEAFTDPVKDPDPKGKIHGSGVKMEIDVTDIKTGDKKIRRKTK